MKGLQAVYRRHHANRGKDFAILENERGAFLRSHIGTGKHVLDIGCRDGKLTSTYVAGNQVTGADIDADALQRAEQKLGIKTLHVDLNDSWEALGTGYDVVVACEFLEHIYFPDLVVQKVKDVLAEDGIFVGSVPHAYTLPSRIKFLLGMKRGTPLEDPTHINHFTVKEFRTILLKHFDSVTITGYVPPRYRLLSLCLPFAFAPDLLFAAKGKK